MDRLRIPVAAVVLGGGLAIAVAGVAPRTAQDLFILVLLLTGPLFLIFATEPDRLPSHVVPRLPRSPLRAVLISPLLPGGGRGLLLLLLSLAWLYAGLLLGRAVAVPHRPLFRSDDPVQLALVCMYSWIYVAVPCSVLAAPTRAAWKTRVLRAGIVASVFVSWMLGLHLDGRSRIDPSVLVACYMVEEVTKHGTITAKSLDEVRIIVAVFAVAFLVGLPRMYLGVREVWRAVR